MDLRNLTGLWGTRIPVRDWGCAAPARVKGGKRYSATARCEANVTRLVVRTTAPRSPAQATCFYRYVWPMAAPAAPGAPAAAAPPPPRPRRVPSLPGAGVARAPPRLGEIPRRVVWEFTLRGRVPLAEQHGASHLPRAPYLPGAHLARVGNRTVKVFSARYVAKVERRVYAVCSVFRFGHADLRTKGDMWLHYPTTELLALDAAMKDHAGAVRGQATVVPGSYAPVFELFLLRHGAAEVTVLDYIPLRVEHPRVRCVEMEDYWAPRNVTPRAQFGAAVSFSKGRGSNFEHDGLGQYGDPVNPRGDVDAMAEVRAMLCPRGVLFLAVPVVSSDRLLFNQARFYGPLFLARLLHGWTVRAVYNMHPDLLRGPIQDPVQPVFVLENTPPPDPAAELCKVPGMCA